MLDPTARRARRLGLYLARLALRGTPAARNPDCMRAALALGERRVTELLAEIAQLEPPEAPEAPEDEPKGKTKSKRRRGQKKAEDSKGTSEEG
jgi:hypothetical protein